MASLLDATTPFEVRPPSSARDVRRIDRDLKGRVEADQRLRNRYLSLLAEGPDDSADIRDLEARIAELDRENTAALKEHVSEFGWFPRSEWEWRTGWNAWILVQHADHDPQFQERVLATMKPLVAEGEIGLKNYAYLYDRVAANAGLAQRWGTQGRCVAKGRWEPFPVAEPERLDALRDEAGIEPIESFAENESSRCR